MSTNASGHRDDHQRQVPEQAPPTLGQRFRQPQTLLSFLFAILIVAFLVRRLDIDPAEVWRQLRSANLPLFALAVLTFYSGFLLRVVRWRYMLTTAGVTQLPGVKLPSNLELLNIMLLAWFANCVVPAKLGDVYRGFLLKRQSNAPFTTTMGTIAAERLIDFVVLLLLLVSSGLVVFGTHLPSGTRSVVVYGGATILAGVAAIGILWRFRSPLLRRLPARLADPVDRVQTGLFENLKNPWRSAGYSVLLWLLDGTRFFLVAWSLNVMLPIWTSLFIALLASLASVSPVTPAGLGVVEAVLISVLPLVGVAEDSATAIAILERLVSYWSLILVGLPLYIVHVRRDISAAVQQEPISA
ncbi:MAG TPA: lysylphosphatidylglycerol synthase transmembrane domain-containing protein [Thermomicrobiales bacterium]|nr:lysylphosphatidylglycerol synthase transmembrane domain-containing protein [Thermomicrobiales bacterium]